MMQRDKRRKRTGCNQKTISKDLYNLSPEDLLIQREAIVRDGLSPPSQISSTNPRGGLSYVILKPSHIHGTGVFATRNIPNNALICWYSGTRTLAAPPTDPDLLDFGRRLIGNGVNEDAILCQKSEEVGHYCNGTRKEYARNQNADLVSYPLKCPDVYGRTFRGAIQSIRYIRKGEEIIVYYGNTYNI